MLDNAAPSWPSHPQPLPLTKVAAASMISPASIRPAARSCEAASVAKYLSSGGEGNFSVARCRIPLVHRKDRFGCQVIYFRLAPATTSACETAQNHHVSKLPVVELFHDEFCYHLEPQPPTEAEKVGDAGRGT